jgi:hypothetical protein
MLVEDVDRHDKLTKMAPVFVGEDVVVETRTETI